MAWGIVEEDILELRIVNLVVLRRWRSGARRAIFCPSATWGLAVLQGDNMPLIVWF